MIKLTKEQKEKIKELKRIEEEHAGEGEYRRSQDSENEDFDNEEEKYDGYDESNEYYDEPDPYDDYEQELINNEDDDDDSDSNIDYYADIAVQALNEEERKELEEEETELRNEWIKCEKEKRARIAFEKQDGSIISSVVEKWGEQLRWTLIEHFNDEKVALKVSEVGSIDHKEEDCSALQQTIKKLIQEKNNNRTKELQAFENFDEYDKYIKDARDIDCAYLWRNKSWEFLDFRLFFKNVIIWSPPVKVKSFSDEGMTSKTQ